MKFFASACAVFAAILAAAPCKAQDDCTAKQAALATDGSAVQTASSAVGEAIGQYCELDIFGLEVSASKLADANVCKITMDAESMSQVIDFAVAYKDYFADASAYDNYLNACAAADGRICKAGISLDMSMTFSMAFLNTTGASGDPVDYAATFDFENIPVCVAKDCSADEAIGFSETFALGNLEDSTANRRKLFETIPMEKLRRKLQGKDCSHLTADDMAELEAEGITGFTCSLDIKATTCDLSTDTQTVAALASSPASAVPAMIGICIVPMAVATAYLLNAI